MAIRRPTLFQNPPLMPRMTSPAEPAVSGSSAFAAVHERSDLMRTVSPLGGFALPQTNRPANHEFVLAWVRKRFVPFLRNGRMSYLSRVPTWSSLPTFLSLIHRVYVPWAETRSEASRGASGSSMSFVKTSSSLFIGSVSMSFWREIHQVSESSSSICQSSPLVHHEGLPEYSFACSSPCPRAKRNDQMRMMLSGLFCCSSISVFIVDYLSASYHFYWTPPFVPPVPGYPSDSGRPDVVFDVLGLESVRPVELFAG